MRKTHEQGWYRGNATKPFHPLCLDVLGLRGVEGFFYFEKIAKEKRRATNVTGNCLNKY